MATTPSGNGESQGFPVGFALGRKQRILCGGVGLALMAFGGFSAVFDDPSATAVVALALGGVFFLLALIGRFGRVTVEGAGARISVEPHQSASHEPDADVARRVSIPERPEPPESKPSVPDNVAAPEAVEGATSPIMQAFAAWGTKDYATFDSKMKEAGAAEEDVAKKVGLEAMRLGYLYQVGQTDKLHELLKLRREHPALLAPITQLGASYQITGDHEKEAQIYGEGFESSAIDVAGRLRLLSELVHSLRRAKRFDEAEKRLTQGLEIAGTNEAKAEVHISLAWLYDEWKKNDLKHWHLEKALEAIPGDVPSRFSLAYSYAADGWHLAALHHYDIVQAQRRGPAELNNIAVMLDEHLDMPITAAARYRAAIEEGSTLAAGNLAKVVGKLGLVKEAREIVDAALKKDEADKSVHEAAVAISQWEDNETERMAKIREGGRVEHSFLLRRMELKQRSLKDLEPQDIEGTWETSFVPIPFEAKDQTLRAAFSEKGIGWDWVLTGNVSGRIYTFTWSNDHRSVNHEGDGYFMFRTDDEFEGLIRHTPAKGEVKLVSGRRKHPQASSEELTKRALEALPRLGESPPDE